jgi:uncharacterized RDD family membrane protein YckC
MKCLKCGYLSFKDVERCLNCGYDFSLSSPSTAQDLVIRSAVPDTPRPLDDLALIDAALPLIPSDRLAAHTPNLGAVRAMSVGPTPELPLFGSPIVDDVPLITRASPPRTPLAVRRATPEVPRLRSEPRTPMLDLMPPEAEPRQPPTPGSVQSARTVPDVPARSVEAGAADEPAGLMARMAAAAIDVVVLAGVDVAVVYFTMQICGVTLAELSILPKGPLLAFLVVQNVSYFVAFTAGGQTMGQMALGIKVVSGDAGSSPDLAHAIVRTLVWAGLAVPAGLGLLSALFSRDHRGLHDRCAGTRVVRANV